MDDAPSPRRLRKMREAGATPFSLSLIRGGAWVGLLAQIPRTLSSRGPPLREFLRLQISGHVTVLDPAAELASLGAQVTAALTPILGAGAALAILLGLAQTGGYFAVGRWVPSLKRLTEHGDTSSGSYPERLDAILRSLGGGLLVIGVMVLLEKRWGSAVEGLVQAPEQGASLAALCLLQLANLAGLFALGLGALDLALRHLHFRLSLRTSLDHRKREQRDAEMHPQLRAAAQRARLALLDTEDIGAIERVTWMLRGNPDWVVALAYNATRDRAPKVVAQARGSVGDRWILAAQKRGIPVVNTSQLARQLFSVPVGSEIPPKIYSAVAEVFWSLQTTSWSPSSGHAREQGAAACEDPAPSACPEASPRPHVRELDA